MSRKKKSKVVWVGTKPITPFNAKELRRIERNIRKHHDKLRRRYKEVRGKKVDWISYSIEDGWLCFTVRFMDKTALHLQVSPKLVLGGLERSDWASGDDKVLRTYYRPRDEH